MGVFRFSNAVSDISKFIETYKSIYNNFKDKTDSGEFFGHEEAAEFLALNGLATSLGAVGKEALKRSTRSDKSRDPLYNQHKSYSEIFRMLGWYEPGSKQTNFKLTEFGAYIAESDEKIQKELFKLNILHIASPNPLTTVKGYNVLRPFAFLLKLMMKLDKKITRDEMILGVLACADDTKENSLEDTAKTILKLRTTRKKKSLDDAILDLRKTYDLGSPETLSNYTRFPIAAMKWTDWAEGVSRKGLYGANETIKCLELTEMGVLVAGKLLQIPDIRMADIMKFPQKSKSAFVALSNLIKLKKCGFNLDVYESVIPVLRKECEDILLKFKVKNDDFLFFAYQEAPRELLKDADELLETLT